MTDTPIADTGPQLAPWRENEDGPDCSCGNPTVVKLLPDGAAVLMCLFHTAEAGLFTPLPAERPAEWPALTREEPS